MECRSRLRIKSRSGSSPLPGIDYLQCKLLYQRGREVLDESRRTLYMLQAAVRGGLHISADRLQHRIIGKIIPLGQVGRAQARVRVSG